MYVPLALQCRPVWCYVLRSIQHFFTWQMFLPHVITVNTTFLSIDSGSHAFATSRSSSLRTDERHTSCRNTACYVFAFAGNVCNTVVFFPLEGQCCECCTFSWISWDASRLALPLEMSLAVTFSSCGWITIHEWEIHRNFDEWFCHNMTCV
jgi:hypothetical protein